MIPNDDETFDQFLTANTDRIRRMARDGRWRIPWQDAEDTEQDMAMVLYKAYLHHKPRKGPFQPYFNTLWARFKASAIRSALRGGRGRRVIVLPCCPGCGKPIYCTCSNVDTDYVEYRDDGLLDDFVEQSEPLIDIPVSGIDPLERLVWLCLQVGYSRSDVIDGLNISKRRYYRMIETWRENLDNG